MTIEFRIKHEGDTLTIQSFQNMYSNPFKVDDVVFLSYRNVGESKNAIGDNSEIRHLFDCKEVVLKVEHKLVHFDNVSPFSLTIWYDCEIV
jgi:hypothetical protein